MSEIFKEIGWWIYKQKPGWMALRSEDREWNFQTIHYFYIMGMAILGSICVYPHGNIRYIDALFMASGAATQSGLNSVNINDMNTFQQVALLIIAMMCNPITINTFVVGLRLYWFEQRFREVAKEALRNRRSLAKSFSKSKTNERNLAEEERGVGGRKIVVMHNTTRPNGMTNKNATAADLGKHLSEMDNALAEKQTHSSEESGKSNPSGGENGSVEVNDDIHRQIKFADQINPRDFADGERMPSQRTKEEHIAFLQRQRDATDGAVLRIPGPRDFDAGVVPEAVGESDPVKQAFTRTPTFNSAYESHRDDNEEAIEDYHSDTDRPRRNITIEEPEHPHPHTEHVVDSVSAASHVIGLLKVHRPRWLGGKKHRKHDSSTQSSGSTALRTLKSVLSREKDQVMPYLSWEATVGRNSVFIDLDDDQREELGGIEYRSLKTLLKVLVGYNVGFTLFGIVCLTPWILHSRTYGSIVEMDGQGRVWWGMFTPISAFTDLGYTLTPDSMSSFNTAIWPLLLMSFLIIIGNTGFPIMLRAVIWTIATFLPSDSPTRIELQFLLDHPRRCFTLLFPSKATMWLAYILIFLNGLDLLFFIVLDLGNTIVTEFPLHIRFLDGWFQAVSTRTAGFAVVNLALLHPAIQVSYLIMMYISVLPIAISVRRTNVYEENSLGIYSAAGENENEEGESSYVGQHLRMQLSFDLWFIFLGFFFIAIAEGPKLQNNIPGWSMFSVMFEIVSAYGTVGLSLGFPNIDESFSAVFSVVSKLVIIAMQIRGRHRGLPYDLDKAILLPSEQIQKLEAANAAQYAQRRSSGDLHNLERATSRQTARSQDRAGNLLSTLLHPGPTMPNSHRTIIHGDRRSSVNSRRTRRSSAASNVRSPERGPSTAVHLDGIEEDRGRRVEGRKSFFDHATSPSSKAREDQIVR